MLLGILCLAGAILLHSWTIWQMYRHNIDDHMAMVSKLDALMTRIEDKSHELERKAFYLNRRVR